MIKVPRASEASATPTGADLFADDDSLEAAAATRGWAAPARRSGRGGGRAGAIGTRRQPVQGGQAKQRKAGEASQLAPIALRPSNSRAAWCADWWAHPDAVSRLGTAWMAWEAAWAEGGTAPSRWWAVDWAERWLAPSNKSGTFSGCSSGGHRDVSPPCPITPVPERHKQNVQP